MSAVPESVRFNYQDLLQTPDDGRRYEVAEGDLLVSPAPNPRHQRVLFELAQLLAAHVRRLALGTVYVAPVDVKFSDESVVEPDIVYLSNAKADGVLEKFIAVPPDLAVEVLSESSRARDFGEKMKLYARNGVPHYWIVDPDARRLWEYTLSGGAYGQARELDDAATFEPALFPGLAISLSEVFGPPRK